MHIILSCEHAVNTIPSAFEKVFQSHQALLETHRGLDIGAQSIARKFAEALNVPYVEAVVSRLLIDCNRSLNHPHCFSFISDTLSPEEKAKIIHQYYEPHRSKVFHHIEHHIKRKEKVLHLSIHSSTPVMNGEIRKGDLGLLYDPARPLEKKIAPIWQQFILQQTPQFHIRRNYPYLGKANGLTTTCRKKYPPSLYAGIEIEFNQGTISDPDHQRTLENAVLAWLLGLLH